MKLVTLRYILTQFPIQLHATSLTYYSLIAFVPLLAFWLGLLEFLHIDDLFHTVMHGFLDPLGNVGETIGSTLFDFVHNTHAGFIRHLTLIFTLFSVAMLIGRIEFTLNALWQQKMVFNRRLFQKWLGIFAFILLASATLFAIKQFPFLLQHIASYLFTLSLLTLLFKYIPNRPIKTKAAVSGAVLCFVLWFPLSLLFHKLIYWNNTYTAVFHDFVGIIIMLLWLNMLWGLFLAGAVWSKYLHHKKVEAKWICSKVNYDI